ncbi:cysteine-rich CWC family protein [Variovorax sp. dw_308]|uniref:cysteine-rich CWC family protein n=1 Tax=Variovorax sp. dw_308 TaxID=2721546 RepID=UPI001C48D299|nr:cysteine-rich CWC family protein [Variovorax sp. dw_308]
MTAPAPVDPSHCPLCGAANACAMEVARETGVAQPPCWCMSATFTAALIQSVPPQARGTACICAACAAKAAAASSPTETTTGTP